MKCGAFGKSPNCAKYVLIKKKAAKRGKKDHSLYKKKIKLKMTSYLFRILYL